MGKATSDRAARGRPCSAGAAPWILLGDPAFQHRSVGRESLADHDQTDFEGLGEITARMNAAKDEIDELEMRWLELSEQLEG